MPEETTEQKLIDALEKVATLGEPIKKLTAALEKLTTAMEKRAESEKRPR